MVAWNNNWDDCWERPQAQWNKCDTACGPASTVSPWAQSSILISMSRHPEASSPILFLSWNVIAPKSRKTKTVDCATSRNDMALNKRYLPLPLPARVYSLRRLELCLVWSMYPQLFLMESEKKISRFSADAASAKSKLLKKSFQNVSSRKAFNNFTSILQYQLVATTIACTSTPT